MEFDFSDIVNSLNDLSNRLVFSILSYFKSVDVYELSAWGAVFLGLLLLIIGIIL